MMLFNGGSEHSERYRPLPTQIYYFKEIRYLSFDKALSYDCCDSAWWLFINSSEMGCLVLIIPLWQSIGISQFKWTYACIGIRSASKSGIGAANFEENSCCNFLWQLFWSF